MSILILYYNIIIKHLYVEAIEKVYILNILKKVAAKKNSLKRIILLLLPYDIYHHFYFSPCFLSSRYAFSFEQNYRYVYFYSRTFCQVALTFAAATAVPSVIDVNVVTV